MVLDDENNQSMRSIETTISPQHDGSANLLKLIDDEISRSTDISKINNLLDIKGKYIKQQEDIKDNEHRRSEEKIKSQRDREKQKSEEAENKAQKDFEREQAQKQQEHEHTKEKIDQYAGYIIKAVGVVVGIGLIVAGHPGSGISLIGLSLGVKIPTVSSFFRRRKDKNNSPKEDSKKSDTNENKK